MFRLLLAIFAVAALSPAALADNSGRGGSLAALSRVFGELHHVRRMCDPDREGNLWRDQMKRLIDFEQPSYDVREQMVAAFNNGYVSAQASWPVCDRGAEDFAAARALAGEAIVRNLTAPLYAAARGEESSDVTIVRGDNEPE